jgi:hypothetical protein
MSARNVVQVMASYPVGILADRFGALSVLVGGYVWASSRQR